ncbi:MAG TPA: beta-ketoacyl-ACP synthase II [Polyangiaceae bacterium]|nr:beta-ketoacyl-ACP synthase II [Polyangiaceae bacterium]
MERVVITGIGLVTPNGIGTGESWKSIVEGQPGIAPITLFDASNYNSRIAGEVKSFDPLQFIEKKKIKEMARFVQLSMAASKLAVKDGHLELSDEDRETAGCFIGVGLGGLEGIEAMGRTLVEKGPSRISPYFIPSVIANLAAGQVSIALGLKGPSYCITSACSSSAHAIGEACEWIRRGRANLIVAGGSESTITGLGVGGFCAMFALSRRNDEPGRASRPFDKGRDGFVIGEGAGTLILESLTHAKKRGATIYAEITGYGATSDAHHLTQPAPEGAGAQRSMRMALADAKLDPSRIDYMNAHGTSTQQGDIQESRAIEHVFGDHAVSKKLWVSSTKSMMGHLLGGAGAVEAALCALAIAKGVVPPTINLDDQDPECRLDYVPNVARERRIDHAMSNSFGFGGTNCSLLLSRAP